MREHALSNLPPQRILDLRHSFEGRILEPGKLQWNSVHRLAADRSQA